MLFLINSFDVVLDLWWLIGFEFGCTSCEDGNSWFPECCVGAVCCDNRELLININYKTHPTSVQFSAFLTQIMSFFVTQAVTTSVSL
jgi:hypothetical protein